MAAKLEPKEQDDHSNLYQSLKISTTTAAHGIVTLTMRTPPIYQSMWAMFTVVLLLIISVLMVVCLSLRYYYYYYIVIIVYGLIIIFHYGSALIKFAKISNSDQNKCKRIGGNIFSVIYHYYFYFEVLFCSLYQIITAVLIFLVAESTEDYLAAFSYCTLSISIPLPLICLQIFAKEKTYVNIDKCDESQSQNRDDISVAKKKGSIQSQLSSSSKTKLLTFVPLRENGIKYSTCMVYVAYTVSWILHPMIHWKRYVNETKRIYKFDMLTAINQSFFRSFVGMLLFQTIFAFLLILLDPRYQFLTKKFSIFKNMYNYKERKRSTIGLVVAAFILLFLLDSVQLISQKEIDFRKFHIDWTPIHHQTDGYFSDIINIFWIVMHFIGMFICFIYLNYFHAIKRKKYKKQRKATIIPFPEFFTIPKAFLIQSSVLILAYSLMIGYLLKAIIPNPHLCQRIRQISMVIFMLIESVSIYYLISIQDVCSRSFKKNNWRANLLQSCYFQFITALNIYDFIYLSLLKIIYYNDLNDSKIRVSYSFSFSSLTLLSLLSVQLLITYGQWKGIIEGNNLIIVKSNTETTISEIHSLYLTLNADELTIDNLIAHNSNLVEESESETKSKSKSKSISCQHQTGHK